MMARWPLPASAASRWCSSPTRPTAGRPAGARPDRPRPAPGPGRPRRRRPRRPPSVPERGRRDPLAAVRPGQPAGPAGALDLRSGRPRRPAVLVGDRRPAGARASSSPPVAAVRRGRHRRRQRPLLPAAGRPVAGGEAHPGRLRRRRLRLVHRSPSPTHATPGDISTVEAPLAVLFAWVLCTHAFDVPARRDVAYSLAGSAALMAVAAAQSVDLALGRLRGGLGGVRRLGTGRHVAVDVGDPGVPWLTLGVAGVAGGRGGRRCWSPCCPLPRCRPR